jgi:hypothetical protein
MVELGAALLGALIGGFFAVWGGTRQLKVQRERRVRSLTAALSAEIASLIEIVRRNRYEESLRAVVRHVRSPAFDGTYDAHTVHASHSYFTVYEANASDIGELEPQLAVEVIAFYQQARSWLDGIAMASKLPDGVLSADEVARYYTLMADSLTRLMWFGDDLAARLAPANLSKHILHAARRLDATQPTGISSRLIEPGDQPEPSSADTGPG